MSEKELADKIIELSTEFGKFLLDHPEIAERIPSDAEIIFIDESDPALSKYELGIAKKAKREGRHVVVIKIKGVSEETSRLIEPEVELTPVL